MKTPSLTLFATTIVLVATATPSFDQSNIFQQGIKPVFNYIDSPIDSVNTSNGNLVVHIPLISYKQKGTLPDFALFLLHNNKSWTLTQYEDLCSNQGHYYTCYLYSYNGSGVQVAREGGISAYQVLFPDPFIGDNNSLYQSVGGIKESSGGTHQGWGFIGPDGNPTWGTVDGSGLVSDIGYAGVRDAHGILHSNIAGGDERNVYGDEISSGFYDNWTDPSGNTISTVFVNSATQDDYWIDSIGRNIPAPGKRAVYQSPGCTTYQYPSEGGGTSPYTICYQNYVFNPPFPDIPGIYIVPDSYNVTAIASVTLPNNTSYTFSYNSGGDLLSIGLPSGGTISYEWMNVESTGSPGVTAWERAISSRTLNLNDGSPAQTWTYSYSVPTNLTTVTDPLGNQSTYPYTPTGLTGTYYAPNFLTSSGAVPYSPVYLNEVHYQGPVSGGNVLSTISHCYYQNANFLLRISPLGAPDLIPCGTITTIQGPSGPLVSSTVVTDDPPIMTGWWGGDTDGTVLGTTKMSMGFPVSTTITAYGAGVPGPALKTTTTQYKWQTTPSYFTARLLNLPASVSVIDGSSDQLSQTTYGYDENNGSPLGVRGNLTSVARWNSASQTPIIITTAYNSNGMPTDSYDANVNANLPGDHVHISYDATGLYPSSVQHSTTSSASHVEYMSYDLNTGNLLWHTDQNGSGTNDVAHAVTYSYNDPLNRLTKILQPPTQSGVGETDISYNDSAHTITSTTISTPNPAQTTLQWYDAFGRLGLTQLPNGATTETKYDALGRVASVSNPHFDGAVAYTTYAYDALNRMLYKCNQDNGTGSSPCVPGASYQQWAYAGNVTTFYDELRNSWQRTSDALGRLKQVVEPGGLTTQYSYDALSNLLTVNQLGNAAIGDTSRTRSFSYDSLSRLLTANNPETGTVGYTYDANGNVHTKTDARGITTAYNYDALNRLLSKSYSDNATPISCYQYDLSSASNGIGRLANAWTMRFSASCATTAPSTGFLTKRSISAYDAMGRIVNEQQFTKASQASGAIYAPAYTYDLAGHLLSSTNGVGSTTPAAPPITFTYTLDNAGRLQTLNSSLQTATVNQTTYTLPTTLFSPPTDQSFPCANSTSTQYTAFGGLANALYGSGLRLNRSYDSRLRTTCESNIGSF